LRRPGWGTIRTPRPHRLAAVTATALAAVLAGCGSSNGPWQPIGDASGGRQPSGAFDGRGTSTLAWKQPLDKTDDLVGSWVSDTTAVAIMGSKVAAYKLDGGTGAWGLTMPSGYRVCTASRDLDSGVGAIVFGTDSHSCNHVDAIDARTGKVRWQVDIPSADSTQDPPIFPHTGLAVVDGLVVTNDQYSIRAYAVADGRQRWTSAPQTAPGSPDRCDIHSVAAARHQVAATFSCEGAEAGYVATYDVTGGAQRWRFQGSTINFGNIDLLSADPVIGMPGGDVSNVSAFPDGKTQVPLNLAGLGFDPHMTSGASRHNTDTLAGSSSWFQAVGTTAVFVGSTWHDGAFEVGHIGAMDVTTGRVRWTKQLGDDGHDSGAVLFDIQGTHVRLAVSAVRSSTMLALSLADGGTVGGTAGVATPDQGEGFSARHSVYLAGRHVVDVSPDANGPGSPMIFCYSS
jgi:outer membrane protein assembly factor BamB